MILKKIVSVILTVCIMSMSFSSLVSVNAQTKDEQSSIQTAESPNIDNEQKNQIDQNEQNEFVINNADDFSEFMKNSDDEGNPCNYWEGNYKITLTCDIGMGDKTFKPIETFNGQFDGNGHTISNLTIQSSSNQNKNFKLAFIKTLSEGATFKNIMFNNYTIEDTASVKDITYQSAGFVLNNYGKVSGISIENGTMVNVNKSKNGDAAGFVRVNEKGATIENCSINMKSEKSNINAGFVSYNFGTISGTKDDKCTTNLPVNYGENAGGFVSENFGTINWCTSEGEVTGKNCLGGFCGYNKGLLSEYDKNKKNNDDKINEGIIENCTSAGNVTANTSKSQVICGGFVGQNGGKIEKCNVAEKKEVTGGEYIGGFCGLNREFGDIEECKSKNCKVKSSTWLSSVYCGGFVGVNKYMVNGCEFSGTVNGCLDTEKLLAIGVSSAVAAALIVGVIYYLIARYNSNVVNADVANDISLARENTLDDCRITLSPLIDTSISERCARSANHRYTFVLDSIFAKFKNSEILKAIALTTIVACIASVVTGVVIEETAKHAYVGGFCGYNYCGIFGSTSESKVEAKTLYNKYTKCGGFVGTNDGVVQYSNAYGEGGENGEKGEINFKMYAGGYLGGFVGENISNIYACESKINVENGKYTGGFCGYNEGGILKSNTEGDAKTDAKTCTNTTRCGGFVGYHKKGMINGCESIGDATGQEYVGGFCGDNVAKIINCKSTGSATAKAKIKTTKCGGFVGENSGTIDNSNCDSKTEEDTEAKTEKVVSTVKVKGQEYVGGFVGMNKSDINNCSCITESVKAKTETHNAYAGGFVGVNSDGTINECTTKNSSEKTDASEKTRSVEAKSNSGQAKVGGFVGVNKAKIKNSNSIGHHIYLSSGVCWEDNGCGGFVGKNDKGSEVEIDDCKVEGVKDDGGKETIKCKVETKRKKKGGGFVGEVKEDSKINNSSCRTHRVEIKEEKKLEKRNEFYYSYYKKVDEKELKKFVGCLVWDNKVDEQKQN